MKKVLIVNFYGDNPKIPGGRRTVLWKKLLAEKRADIEIYSGREPSAKRVGLLVKLFRRVGDLFKSYPGTHKVWINDAVAYCKKVKPDVIILCCPIYDVLELLDEEFSAQMVVDIRDGIYFESLFTGVEKIRYKKSLLALESKLKNADVLLSNIPGLSSHYGALTGKSVGLIYNQFSYDQYITTRRDSMLKISYAGGLMRSGWGQNAISVCRGLRKLVSGGIEVELHMVGRFNAVEKLLYGKLFSSIKFLNEISARELSELVKDYNCLLMVNTTSRDLLPSKFWFYITTDALILSVSASKSLKVVSGEVPGFINVANDSDQIYMALKDLDYGQKYDREGLLINDDSKRIFDQIFGE